MEMQEAKTRMALLMVQRAGLRAKSSEEAVIDERLKEMKRLDWQLEHLGAELNANPVHFDILNIWMVDISGSQPCNMKAIQAGQAVSSASIAALQEAASGLSVEVRTVIESVGLSVTDSGGGCDGWDIGVRCTEPGSRILCEALYGQFPQEVRTGALTVARKFWGCRPPGLGNLNDAQAWLRDRRKHGRD